MDFKKLKEKILREKDGLFGRLPRSEEHRKNQKEGMKKSRKGKFCWNNGIQNYYLDPADIIPSNLKKGMKPQKPRKLKNYIKIEEKIKITPEEIQEKKKVTMLEKYGVEYTFQSKEIQRKIKETMIERYGVENVGQSFEIQQKKKNTLIEKYGVENPNQKHLKPIVHLLQDQEWWNKFNSGKEIKNELEDFLSPSGILGYTHQFRPDLVRKGKYRNK